MSSAPPNRNELISEFTAMSGTTSAVAERYLAASLWDFESAVTEYFNRGEDLSNESAPTQSSPPPPALAPSSIPAAPAQPQKPKFATLGDLNSNVGSTGHAGHGHDDVSDDDDENQDLYTGGEKSGLAVENPDDLKRKIIERAKKNLSRPGGDAPRTAPSRFTGTARTLGGDDTPSQVIEDPQLSRQPLPSREVVERRLHFWRDGFSVDDGPLHSLDDPTNRAILRQIKEGSAPLGILNVQPNQEVDVKLEQHDDVYIQPKKKYKPFSSGGQRLGSPTPGLTGTGMFSENARPPPAASTSLTENPSTHAIGINEEEPTVSVQVRLGDGTRLVSRFNITHTVGDIYSFVGAASPASSTQRWTLMTTFPSKELDNQSLKLADLAEFKRGGVVVQKWK